MVARAYVTGLLEFASPKEGNHDSLVEFAGAIKAAVADLQHGEHLHDLYAPGLLNQITKKLPSNLRSKWGEHIFLLQPRAATLIDLDQWLESRVLMETWTPEATFTRRKDQKEQSKKDTSKTNSTGRQAEGRSKIFLTKTTPSCPSCDDPNHELPDCDAFVKLDPKERAQLTLDKMLLPLSKERTHQQGMRA